MAGDEPLTPSAAGWTLTAGIVAKDASEKSVNGSVTREPASRHEEVSALNGHVKCCTAQ